MELRARFFVIGLCLLGLLMVINLVRTRRLKEEFAILWLLIGVTLVLLPVFVDEVDAIAYAVGIEYPPAFVFLIALLGIIFILFQFSVSISRYSEQIKVLSQEIALLRERLRQLERQDSTINANGPGNKNDTE